MSDGKSQDSALNLRRKFQHLALDATQEIRSQTIVKLLDEIFSERLVFLSEPLEIVPFHRVQEVHQVEQLPDVVV
jgi:hypothetical protein